VAAQGTSRSSQLTVADSPSCCADPLRPPCLQLRKSGLAARLRRELQRPRPSVPAHGNGPLGLLPSRAERDRHFAQRAPSQHPLTGNSCRAIRRAYQGRLLNAPRALPDEVPHAVGEISCVTRTWCFASRQSSGLSS